MRFFIKKYLSEATLALADDYVRFEALKSGLEERRPQLYEQVLELQEQELAGKSNPKALQAAQGVLTDTDQKILAAGRAMSRIQAEIPAALATDIDLHYRNLSELQEELSQRRAAAARRAHLGQEVASFFQGHDPAGLEAVAAKLAKLQAELESIKSDPEALDFEDLTQVVGFIERVWASEYVSPPSTMREALNRPMSNTHNLNMEREGHMKGFGRQIIAAAREKAGTEAPAPEQKSIEVPLGANIFTMGASK